MAARADCWPWRRRWDRRSPADASADCRTPPATHAAAPAAEDAGHCRTWPSGWPVLVGPPEQRPLGQ